MKLFSIQIHGVLDYLSVAGLLALPRVLRWSPTVTQLLSGAALATLGYSLLTDYDYGLIKVLPFKTHLALDAASGLLLTSAPFWLRDEDQRVRAALLGIGLFELSAATGTETAPGQPAAMAALPPVLAASTFAASGRQTD